jgi:short-subunit dehydrogenase
MLPLHVAKYKTKLKNQIVWITGASSGIGEALAYRFSEYGCRLILSARREDELQRVKQHCSCPDKCRILVMDLSDPQQVETTAEKALAQFGYVDILINNGGVSQRSLIRDTSIETDRRIMETNYFSGVILTKKILPSMLSRQAGHIVAVSSIVGMFGFMQRSAYSASKHAMHGFYETLWAENGKEGIKTTIVCPGRIHTNISLNALTGEATAYGIMDHGQNKGISADVCAKKIIQAIRKNRREVFICRKDIWLVRIKRFAPWLYYRIVCKIKSNG